MKFNFINLGSKDTRQEEMSFRDNRLYSLFLQEHLPSLTYLFKKVVQPVQHAITFEDWCEFSYANSTIRESNLRDNRRWD